MNPERMVQILNAYRVEAKYARNKGYVPGDPLISMTVRELANGNLIQDGAALVFGGAVVYVSSPYGIKHGQFLVAGIRDAALRMFKDLRKGSAKFSAEDDHFILQGTGTGEESRGVASVLSSPPPGLRFPRTLGFPQVVGRAAVFGDGFLLDMFEYEKWSGQGISLNPQHRAESCAFEDGVWKVYDFRGLHLFSAPGTVSPPEGLRVFKR